MDLLRLQGVAVGYHRRPLLPPVDLGLRRGMFLGIVGPNGSGKTTLVRTLLGLLPPVAGHIASDGAPPRFGYVPQRDAVDLSFPLTAREIVLMGCYGRLAVGRRPRPEQHRAAEQALREVGAEALAERLFHALSGGQRQRVLIARALAGAPDILVLDEPTTGMDLPSERAMLDLVASFCARDLAVVMVSHQLGAVADYATDLCLIPGEGRPAEVGPRAELLTDERLSRVYGQPVAVASVAGHAAIYIARPGAHTTKGLG